MKVAIIGGGAAGYFAAIQAKSNYPNAAVILFEKNIKLLSKVKISGGGRCNVTNGASSPSILAKAYPRGGKQLKKAFNVFATTDTRNWFESRGVKLYTQEDGRVFPVSNDSSSIVNCLMKAAHKNGVDIHTKQHVAYLKPIETGIELQLKNETEWLFFDKVIIATGGGIKLESFDWLKNLGHKIVPPVPSLFTFNMPNESIKTLMGTSVSDVQTSIVGSKLKAEGPLLITHWGMSGPAILKLSAFGARSLNELNYQFKVSVNWLKNTRQDLVFEDLNDRSRKHPKKQIGNIKINDIPKRLWHFLIQKNGIAIDRVLGELGSKSFHKLSHCLTNDQYEVNGKTTFKEEFVTAGGIDLSDINFKTMQSRKCKNVYFAGEVMNIDGITGGYNFQAAWTTAFIAGKLLD